MAATEELSKNTRLGQRERVYGEAPKLQVPLGIGKQKSGASLRGNLLQMIEEVTPRTSKSSRIPTKKHTKPKNGPTPPIEQKSEILSKILNSVQEIRSPETREFLKSSSSIRKVKSPVKGFDVNEMIKDVYKNMH